MPKQNFRNDAIALIQLTEGDILAYKFLFDHHFTDLCNFLMFYLHSNDLAEEIALEIFTYIWEKRKTIGIKTNFKSFLFASAKNKAISYYRKEQRRIFTTLEESEYRIPEVTGSEDFMENDELRKIIEDAINLLPDKSRMIYQLAWEENLSHKEIAVRLGITSKTVENHVGIALHKLRISLLPYYRQIFLIAMLWYHSN
jgi:RNA polymerase sigma-70 factor (ECF subfamily)